MYYIDWPEAGVVAGGDGAQAGVVREQAPGDVHSPQTTRHVKREVTVRVSGIHASGRLEEELDRR